MSVAPMDGVSAGALIRVQDEGTDLDFRRKLNFKGTGVSAAVNGEVIDVTVAGGGITIGDPITGGGANRVLYEDGSNNIAGSANLTYSEASGPRLQAGSGTTTSAGWILGYAGVSGYANIWATVRGSPTASNAVIQVTDGGGTSIDSAAGTFTRLYTGNALKGEFVDVAGAGWYITAGTATTDVPALSATQTWNAVGVTFKGWDFTITDTASAAGSLAMRIRGGAAGTTTLFSTDKNGKATVVSLSVNDLLFVAISSNNALLQVGSGQRFDFSNLNDGNMNVPIRASIVALADAAATQSQSTDTALARNAAGIVEVNNGTAGTYRDITARTFLPRAGTTTVAPVSFTAGTNLTTAAAGAVEFDGTAYYATAAASSRQVVAAEQFSFLVSDFTLANTTNAQAYLAAAQDTLTVQASTLYQFETLIEIEGMGATTRITSYLLGGTATFTNINYWSSIHHGNANAAVGTQATKFSNAATAQALSVTNASAASCIMIRGTFAVNGAGTIIPQIKWDADPTGTILAKVGTYFKCSPLGSNAVVSQGNWA